TATVNANGTFSYSPALNYNGSDSFTFKANDGSLDSNVATYNVTVTAVNDAPVLDAVGNKTVNEETALSFTASANDVEGDTLTFSLAAGTTGCGPSVTCALPLGATINGSTGAFSWTPSEAQGPGTYRFFVRVTDNGSPNLSDSEEITVTVAEVNVAPELGAV